MNLIFYIVIGLIIGAIICYIIMRPIHELDEETLKNNKELIETCNKLVKEQAILETENKALLDKKNDLTVDIKRITEESTSKAQETYNLAYDAMQERLSQSAEIASSKYKRAEEEAKDEYLKLLKSCQDEYLETAKNVEAVAQTLNDMRNKVNIAIEEEKRILAEEDEKNYYKIKITEEQLWDIHILKEAVKELKGDHEAINKIIWEFYYKKPVTDLLNRITPSNHPIIGIYKITKSNSNKCYIGQSVNIRTRIRDHIKAGLGIGFSNNKFYSEMKDCGPEEFMYEVIEECDRSKLNERERYWIDFYQGVDFGYNSTIGNRGNNE